MSILVTGSTGRIGAQVVTQLAASDASDASVRALTRTPEKSTFPAGVTAVQARTWQQ